MGLPDRIRSAVGQPATVRIGVIASVFPLTVNVQGAIFTDVGIGGSYFPTVGDTVALLGQSPQSGSDATSWLILDSMSGGAQVPSLPRSLSADATAPLSLPLVLTDIVGASIAFTTLAPSTLIQACMWLTSMSSELLCRRSWFGQSLMVRSCRLRRRVFSRCRWLLPLAAGR